MFHPLVTQSLRRQVELDLAIATKLYLNLAGFLIENIIMKISKAFLSSVPQVQFEKYTN